MADFVEVPEVAEFAVHQRMHGQKIISLYNVKRLGGWTAAALDDMCNAIILGYNTDFAPQQSTDLQYEYVAARDLTTAAGIVTQVNFPPASGGDLGNPGMPGNVVLAVAHKTGLAGRSFRGRTFFPGLVENAVTGNEIPTPYKDGIVGAFLALDGRIIAAGGTWGIVSRYSGYTQTPPKYKKVPTPRAVGLFTDITVSSANVFLDSMRRRLTGRGG
jgi:hypothetical protein